MTILLALRTQQFNLAWHTGQKRVSFFQRAHSIQIMQLHNKGYVMSEQEVNNLRILKLTYNVTNKFLTYNWNKDFLWYYGHTLHITTLLRQWKAYNNDEKNNYVHNTILCMCLDHLGLEGTSHLTMEAQDLVQQFRIHNRLDTSFVDRPLQGQRGHEDHKQWIEDNSIWKAKEDDKDKIEDNDEDKDNDKDETKKRKVDN